MPEYRLAITTGNLWWAGTYDYIYATLVGTEGTSERKTLRNWGVGLRTNTTVFNTIKSKSSLGKIELLQLEKESFWKVNDDEWYCSKVVVTSPEEELLFPCYRWLSNGDLLELRGGKATKPFQDVDPMLIEHRKEDIMSRQNLYKWSITHDKIPHHIGFKQVSELPAEVQFTMRRNEEFFFTVILAGLELKFKGWLDSTKQWKTIDAMKGIWNSEKTTMSEYIAEHWKEDDFFGYQFLNGTNPCVIKKCKQLPDNFPVTDEMVKPFLGPGCSLNEEIKKGNIFICDYKILDKIPTRKYGEEHLQMPASMCLFYMNPEKKLMPIAIQLNQQTSEENPIFLPSDSEPDWLLAKMFVKSAHALVFELVYHLMGTHLLAEAFTVAALRNFHPIHPLYKLLIPHFEYTLHINILSRIQLLAPGDAAAFTSSTLGYEGSMELVRRGLAETDYTSLCLPFNISARGLESIPNYYYRDDGMKLWNIIYSYVQKMMQYYYHSDADVFKDTELQGWIQEVFTHGFLGNKASGIPSEFTNVVDLVKFVTMVIFTVSAQHSAINDGQFDHLSFALNGALLLRKPPPTTKGQSKMERTILETAPNIGETVKFSNLTLVLSKKYEDMVMLGNYPDERFDESKPKKIMQTFKSKLSSLSEEIQARNAKLKIPYRYLNPAHILKSIAI